jgi:hypothetical protein
MQALGPHLQIDEYAMSHSTNETMDSSHESLHAHFRYHETPQGVRALQGDS